MQNMHSWDVIVVLALMCCVLIGCGRRSSTADANAHDGHHEHEHQAPSYRGAVKEITFLHGMVLKHLQPADSHKLDHELEQLVEILERLPEIAADSELRKSDWELANQQSVSLLGKYRQFETAVKAGTSSASGALAGAGALIADLDELVPASIKRLK